MKKKINEAARELGRLGGKASFKKLGREKMRELGRLGGLKAKANKEKAKKQEAK